MEKNYLKLILFIAFLIFYADGFSQTASFTVDVTSGCEPLTVNFTNNSTGAVSYYWDFGDGINSTFVNPVHIFYGVGDYTVMLYAYDSLGNSDSTILIINVPSVTPYFNPVAEACPGRAIQFFIIANFDSDNVVYWDFDDGFSSNSAFAEHSFGDTGIYNVVLTVTNSACGTVIDSNQITITNSVIPLIHIHPENTSTTICPGENFPFFYDEDLSIYWDFGDGYSSADPYPSHAYDSTGNYLVTVTVTNECGNSNSLDTIITVDTNVLAVAQIYVTNDTACPDEVISISGTSGFGYSYYWNFSNGDTSTGKNVTYSFADTGFFNIELIVTNACGNQDTAYKTITVVDTIQPSGWLFINARLTCPGNAIWFTAPPGNASYLWNFGDGDTSAERSITHIYNNTGTYPVELTISNYCGNSISLYDTVVVDSSIFPIADFYLNQNSYCPGDIIRFKSNNVNDIASFFWDFGDGNSDTAKNPVHIYIDTGSYDVILKVTNYCGNTDTLLREIILDTNGLAAAGFDVLPGFLVCPDTSLSFVNLGSDTSNCVWTFGDGDTSFSANPVHTFSQGGNYLVKLTVTNSCGNSSILTKLITATNSICTTEPDSIVNIEEVFFETGYGVLIYPNPGTGIFSFDIDDEKNEILNITIFNVLGQVVKKINIADLRTNNNLIDMTNHREGIYTVKFHTIEKDFTGKIILIL